MKGWPALQLSGRVLDAAGLFGRGAIGSLGDHRSLCEPSHGAKLHVLDGGLLPDGDERIAKEWAANFAEKGKVLYLAYRAGERRVDVCEVTDHNVTDKV